jgi:SpoVK/Ycf46/Vps4 family AAA+-type ATPase
LTDEQKAVLTRGAKCNADISALLRARNTCLWLVSKSYSAERGCFEAAASAGSEIRFWDFANGITDAQGREVSGERDPLGALGWIKNAPGRFVYVMRDLNAVMDPMVIATVKSLARSWQGAAKANAKALIILSPSAEVPLGLQGVVTVIDYPLPDRAEIARILDVAIDGSAARLPTLRTSTPLDAAVDAAVGLTAEEAANSYALSLVTSQKIDPSIVGAEKKRVIAREKVLTLIDPDPRGLAAVGGLEVLKGFLKDRENHFSPEARAYGLRAPRGIFLMGVSGCGKSLTPKCIATAWGIPLLRIDVGALTSKWQGESQANIRKALQVAETMGRCVLWFDEIEKAFASADSQGDNGVGADAFGTVLTWMQERTGSVFVVATCNDPRSIKMELFRRFDATFFVDMPTRTERADILKAALVEYGRGDVPSIDRLAVAQATAEFTGAEIAGLVPAAMITSFNDGAREVSTDDLLLAASQVVPLAKSAAEKLRELRTWAKANARAASVPEAEETNTATRNLDL